MKNLTQIITFSSLLVCTSCLISKKSINKNNASNQFNENKLISLLIEATTEKIIGNLTVADSLFKQCLKIDPKNAVSHYELSGIYRMQEQSEKAIEYAKKALLNDPINEWYKANLALFYAELNKFKEASKLFEQLVNDHPEKYEYLYSLSDCYFNLNDLKKSIKVLDQLEESIGINEELILYKYQLYLNIKDINNAILEIEKLINHDHLNVRYYGILAELYESIAEKEKAFTLYEKITTIEPENGIVRLSLFQHYLSIQNENKALLSLKNGFSSNEVAVNIKLEIMANILMDVNESSVFYDAIDDLFSIILEKHAADANAHYFYAEFLLRKKELEGALENFKIAANLDGNSYELWNQIILLELDLMHYEELELDSRKAIELFPSHPTFYYFNGVANLQLKNHQKAITSFKNGLNYIIDDNYLLSDFHQYIGDAYHHINEHTFSDEYYEKALTYNANNTYVLNNYSYYLAKREVNIENAEKMILRALTIAPNNKNYLDTYGWILFLKADYLNAEKQLKKALDLSIEEDGTILEHYGDVLYHLNKYDKALIYWEKAVESGNDSPTLKEKIIEKKYLK